MAENNKERGKPSGREVSDFSNYCEGDVDPTLNKRIRVLTVASKDYIVYLDDDFNVEWSLTEGYDAASNPALGPVQDRVSLLEVQSVDCVPPRRLGPFRRLLAEGLGRVISDRSEAGARALLDRAEEEIVSRRSERARIWYLMASGIAACVVGIIGVVLWACKRWAICILGGNGFDVLLASTLGGLGALISVISRSTRLTTDTYAGSWIHYFEGAARIVTGWAGALFVSLAVKADLVGGIVNTVRHGLPLLLTLGFAAGISERLMPDLIRKVEGSMGETGQANADRADRRAGGNPNPNS